MKKLGMLFGVVAMLIVLQTAAFSATRRVLVEIQTSTTCAPCYAADVFYFQNWLPNYGGASEVVTLSYHVWWPTPGDDPIYLANINPIQTRINYYSGGGSTYAPRAYIDGFIDGTSNYNGWPGAVDGRFLDFSPISITLTGSRNGNTLNVNAAIFAEQAVNSSTWRVHWALVESQISAPQNSGSGYVPFTHDFAHRNMYPDGNGSPITITQGQTVNIPRTITLNSSWVAANCRVIVFVQNNTDKKVQNVQYRRSEPYRRWRARQRGSHDVCSLPELSQSVQPDDEHRLRCEQAVVRLHQGLQSSRPGGADGCFRREGCGCLYGNVERYGQFRQRSPKWNVRVQDDCRQLL